MVMVCRALPGVVMVTVRSALPGVVLVTVCRALPGIVMVTVRSVLSGIVMVTVRSALPGVVWRQHGWRTGPPSPCCNTQDTPPMLTYTTPQPQHALRGPHTHTYSRNIHIQHR